MTAEENTESMNHVANIRKMELAGYITKEMADDAILKYLAKPVQTEELRG